MLDKLTATLSLEAPVGNVNGVSSPRAAVLRGLRISTVRDLITHFPVRYIDMSSLSTISDAVIGSPTTIVGEIYEVTLKRPKPKMDIVEVTIVDGTSTLIATYFKQPWLTKTLKSGMIVSVSGTVEFNYGFKRMTSPFLEHIDNPASVETGKIIPVHRACEKLSSGQIRRLIENAMPAVDALYDPIPLSLRSKYRLMSRSNALHCIHFPKSMKEADQARRRLTYEELLLLELHLLGDSASRSLQGFTKHGEPGDHSKMLETALPFSLTDDQVSAIGEIRSRMQDASCMNHMLLGDVGTGKTVVAGFACALATDNGTQTLMMAPTEVLAWQYAKSLGPLFDKSDITWNVLTGSTPTAEKNRILKDLGNGDIDVLFGTHSLIEPDVICRQCTLAIIDEQQRFGVEQRSKLLEKGTGTDALYMTATPIPRTLALAVYGSLSLSYMKDIPFDRPPRTTKVLDYRAKGVAYDAALAACRRGEQVYVVCPLVGAKKAASDPQNADRENQQLIDSDSDLPPDNASAVEAEAEFLQAKTFYDYKVGLLHGKMTAADKRSVMNDFRERKIDVLVCTTVIEVGVDVPNATVMIIEDADKFGLSQLHQLRGRVGRGTLPGEIYLIGVTGNPQSAERLHAMEETEDGFALAEFDLALRREGDILGNRQSGASTLKLVNIMRDGAIIEAAHADASDLIADTDFWITKQGKVLRQEVEAVFDSPIEHTLKRGG